MATNDYEIKGLRDDIKKIGEKVDNVQSSLGEMKTETAVFKERLTSHITDHNKSSALSPVASMFLRSLIPLVVGGVGVLLVLGIRAWVAQ